MLLGDMQVENKACKSKGRRRKISGRFYCSVDFIVNDKNILSFTIKPPADAHGFCKETCRSRGQNPAQ